MLVHWFCFCLLLSGLLSSSVSIWFTQFSSESSSFFLLVPSPRCLNHSRIFTSRLYAATSKFIFQSGHFPADWNDFHNYIPNISTWMTRVSHGPVQHVWNQNECLSFDIGSPPDGPVSVNNTGIRTRHASVGFLVAMGYNLSFVVMLTNLQDLTSTDLSSLIFLFIQVKLQLYSTSPCFSNTSFKFMSPCSCTCCSCCLDAVPFLFFKSWVLFRFCSKISLPLGLGWGELILTSQSSVRPHWILFVSYTDYKTNSVFIYWHDCQAILLFIFSSTVSGNKSSSLNFILKNQ